MEKGSAFARNGNTALDERPTLVVLSHQDLLIDDMAGRSALREWILVRPFIRERGGKSVTTGEIGPALHDASILAIGPCKQSVPSTEAYRTEEYAAAVARTRNLQLVVVITDPECILPEYLRTMTSQVKFVVGFGVPLKARCLYLESYPRACIVDLYETPGFRQGRTSDDTRQEQWRHYPENLSLFGCALRREMASASM